MRTRIVPACFMAALLVATWLVPVAATSAVAATVELTDGWSLSAAGSVAANGAAISQPAFSPAGWYPVTVPCTVLAGLVANGVYGDIYADTNLQSVPDLTTQDWWYRGAFNAPVAAPGQQYWLRFKGIAYRAQIWLNGTQVDANAIGTLVNHEYNVTSLILPGQANALALKVTPPTKAGTNLSFWYVDWNPAPPDMNAGLWGKVLLETSGPVALRDPYVKTVLPLPATDSAQLTVYVDAVNGSAGAVTGLLSGQVTKPGHPTINFEQSVTLAAGERREIAFDPGSYAQLNVTGPALWWPVNLGSPELYDLQLTFTVAGAPSDAKTTRFGIRQFRDYITPSIYGHTYRGYEVNGRKVLVRGADYVWDMLLRTSPKVDEAHMRYVRDMGLNLVRFEGILGNENLYDLADRYGIMMMPGYVCCTYWAQYGAWTPQDVAVANASTDSQMRLLRAHAGAMVWAYGSDELPPSSVLTAWKSIATGLHWQNPTLDNVASYANPGGSVPKMNGPYVWEPPVYWYADTTKGGAFGFCAEEGGEAVPPEESLRRFLSTGNLWPFGAAYGYHSGPSPFADLAQYRAGLGNRYGAAGDVTQFADRAQLLNYESVRAQFEAFGANAHAVAQGTIYWMLNNAWPSVHWSLYDYYFKPGGAYFGAKKALEPVHILYDYQTRNVKVFNSTLESTGNLTATVTLCNIPDLAVKYTQQATMSFPADAATQVLNVPVVSGLSTTYFIRLRLADGGGAVVSDNLYWYSTSPDVLSGGGDWYYTGLSSYANLTGLGSLAANTDVSAATSLAGGGGIDTVTIALHNASATNVAFFLRPEVTAGPDGPEVTPITYTDNYVTLFPGESTTILATFADEDLGGQAPHVRLRGYNVPATSSPVAGVTEGARGTWLRLRQNSPNPFGAQTVIGFDLAGAAPVDLAIYDVRGRLVRRLANEPYTEGTHWITWDGCDDAGHRVASGSYLARVKANGRVATVRMGVVR